MNKYVAAKLMPLHSQENTCFNYFCKLSHWLVKLQVTGVQEQTKRMMMHKNVAVSEDVNRKITEQHAIKNMKKIN